jgi:tetratricopeptide (TPR) repeat protein
VGQVAGFASAADEAAAREADAVEFPDERGELLLDAALAWRRAGRPSRAAALLAELVAAGGEEGCYARAQRAEFLAADGDLAAAGVELAALAREPALHDGHCQMVAELLIECGELEDAARWYDRAVARLAPATLEALHGPDGWTQVGAVVLLRGRQALRERLGRAPDATDELVAQLPRRSGPGDDLIDLDAVEGHFAAGGEAPHLRMLVFQRDQRAVARARWPQVYPEPDEQYYSTTERRWRRVRESGARSMRVAPVTVDGLVAFAERTGADPTDPAVKTRYVETVPEEAMIAWPPPRNAACWCGLGTKYKKCCGRPG